jgi:hypothetical protein
MQQAGKSEGTPPDAPQDPSSAQAAIAPDETPEAPGSLPTQGSIPVHRHKAVVTNKRREALAEYGIEESVQADGTITRSIEPQYVRNAVALAQLVEKDPRRALRIIQSAMGEEAVATAAPSPPAEKPAEDPEPQPDIELSDGRFVMSHERQREWMAWNQRQLTQQLEKTYGPIRDEHEFNKLKSAQTVEAKNIVAHATAQWPRFAQLKPYIAKIIGAHTGPMTQTSLYDAYIAADREHGEKILRQQWEAERTGQLTRKAAASTVQPGAPRPSTPRPDSELTSRDIVKQEYRRYQAAG